MTPAPGVGLDPAPVGARETTVAPTTVAPEERVILVDRANTPIGTEEKLRAHRKALLHRAVSVFLLSPRGEILLQRRAESKYHSPGLWSNTCCGHPRPGERADEAARRRLWEEMRIEAPLRESCTFVYRAAVPPDLTEHEYDHVFVGTWDGEPLPNPAEVGSWRWVTPAAVRRELAARNASGGAAPGYTSWFALAFSALEGHAPIA